MRQDDPRVERMAETYRKRFIQGTLKAEGDTLRKPANVPDREQANQYTDNPEEELAEHSQQKQSDQQADLLIAKPSGMDKDAPVMEQEEERQSGMETTAMETTVMEQEKKSAIHDEVSRQAVQKWTGYVLVSEDASYRIPIPEQGGVVGRTGIGAHELAHNGRVSRQHMKVIPSRRAKGLLIEDISSNGTFLDGRRILPGQVEFAVIGSEIRLSREVLILREEAQHEE